MSEKILEALKKLDSSNDNQWTAEGLPQMAIMKLLVGDQSLTREAVEQASPGFCRNPLKVGEPAIVESADASEKGSSGGSGTDPEGESDSAKVSTLEALEIARAHMVEASQRKAEADQAFQQANQALDKCIDACEKAGATETLAVQLKGYFAQQNKTLNERAARKSALQGVNVKDIFAGLVAPIDQAMTRRKSFGAKRPVLLK